MMTFRTLNNQALRRVYSRASRLLIVLCLSLTSFYTSADLKQQISQQQNQLTAHQKQLNQLQGDLKKYETSISQIGRTITQTQKQLDTAKANLERLHKQKAELEAQKRQQLILLEQLVQTYYITSRSNDVAVILSGGDPAERDRLSQYFQYLANARAQTILQINQTTVDLEQKEKELSAQQKQHSTLLAEQKAKQQNLTATQNQRKSTVAGIRKNIQSTQSALAELQRNEANLKNEIARAEKRSTETKPSQTTSTSSNLMNGLSAYKGKLPWPIDGNVIHRYGTSQSGQVTWKGIVIDAKQGQAVKAVQGGKVVFAEWLRGYGLVILLDHGKGDMTLYGYNSNLLKKDGDIVKQGETIAQVGNTGGQERSALYFEIRRNSQPQNPSSWLR